MTHPPLIGAHQSIQGGHARAVERAIHEGCQRLQVFTRNNLRWNDKPIAPEDAQRFRDAVEQARIGPVLAHASYLMNLAAPDDALRRKSADSLTDELERCRQLAIPAIVIHPGAHLGAGAGPGASRIASCLNSLLDQFPHTDILLETTAGAGTVIGGAFEQLADIISQLRAPQRAGVCFDTCHVFAAGYDIRTKQALDATLAAFDRVLGLRRIRAFHFNDCKGTLGAHADRHEHIGKGALGDEPFKLLLTDPRFRDVPKLLETPKGMNGRRSWDRINLARLRRLAKSR